MDQSVAPLIFLALIVLAFWVLVIRPARSRARAQQETLRSIEPGDRILMTSGMIGTVVTIGDGEATVELAPGVVVTIVDQAVLRRLNVDSTTSETPAAGGADSAVGTGHPDSSSTEQIGNA